MKRQLQAAFLVGIAWVGAFVISFAVTDWKDDGSVGPIAREVEVIKAQLIETLQPPTATGSPLPTPQRIGATLEAGAEVQVFGLRLSIERIELANERGDVYFTFENVDRSEGVTLSAFAPSATDADGFVCVAGMSGLYGTGYALIHRGEKGAFLVQYRCERGIPLKSLTMNVATNEIRFELP